MKKVPLGIVLPQYLSTATKKEKKAYIKNLDLVLNCRHIKSILFDIKDNLGNIYFTSKKYGDNVKDILLTSDFISRCNSSGVELFAGIRCHDDQNIKDKDIPAVSFDGEKYILVNDRACPSSKKYNNYLIQLASELVTKFNITKIHLSYFRFENITQCFCQRCIEGFKKSLRIKYLSGIDIFRDSVFFVKWIEWRVSQLSRFLKEIRSRIKEYNSNVELSIEVDVDEKKEYLLGIKVEEGIDIKKLSEQVDRFFLHIHSHGWPDNINSMGSPFDRTVKIVNYINGYLVMQNKLKTILFWNLKDYKEFERSIRIYNFTNPDGIFFWFQPEILGWIEKYFSDS